MAHPTTAIAFGTAIFGLVFRERAAGQVFTFLDEIEKVRGSLHAVEASTEQTAAATVSLADRMADRPRFAAESHRVTTGGVDVHQFQMTLENLTDRAITDLVVMIGTRYNGLSSSFLTHVVPPFKTHGEATTGVVDMVCYAYAWGGDHVSETRLLAVNPTPTLDPMGNAATHRLYHVDYVFRPEPDADAFTCGDMALTRSGLAGRKAELDAGYQARTGRHPAATVLRLICGNRAQAGRSPATPPKEVQTSVQKGHPRRGQET